MGPNPLLVAVPCVAVRLQQTPPPPAGPTATPRRRRHGKEREPAVLQHRLRLRIVDGRERQCRPDSRRRQHSRSQGEPHQVYCPSTGRGRAVSRTRQASSHNPVRLLMFPRVL